MSAVPHDGHDAPIPDAFGRGAMQFAGITELAHVTELSSGTPLESMQGVGSRLSDEELVIAAQNGDSSALGELFCRHQRMLYCFARRYVANAEEARDLVQEAMLRAFMNIGRFRRESQFVTWLNRIVINTALSNKRREKRIRWICLDEREGEETRFCIGDLRDGRRDPEEDYSHRELRGLLRREASKLHPKYRVILTACDFDNCSIEQVAKSMGMQVGSAKSRLHRARCSLSAALKKTRAVEMRGDSYQEKPDVGTSTRPDQSRIDAR